LAGAEESPSKEFRDQFGNRRKEYWGQASERGLRDKSNRDRYDETDPDEPLTEGVEGSVPFTGPAARTLHLCAKALRKSMRYCKARDIESHRQNTRFARITNAGLIESHPHDVGVSSTSAI